MSVFDRHREGRDALLAATSKNMDQAQNYLSVQQANDAIAQQQALENQKNKQLMIFVGVIAAVSLAFIYFMKNRKK